MILIPPTTNEWSQNNQTDDQNGSMVSTTRVMERTGQELQQQQHQQEALKCPRCDSSNTKFCYYNNYSLSQPRHFCKACKRYWTRGGTLRNVPVGGGCRKNKRIKRPNSSPADGAVCTSSANSVPLANTSTTSHTQFDASSAANHVNPLLYGLSNNPCDMNLPFYRLNPRVSSVDSTVACYDLQPQLHALGLAFSPRVCETDNQNGFKCNPTNQNHDMDASSGPYLSNYFGGSTSTRTTPIVPSLLTSTLQQQKFLMKDSPLFNNFQGLTRLEELQISGANYGGSQTNGLAPPKQVKAEQGKSRIDWNAFNCQSEMEQVGMPEPDPSFYWNTTTTMGTWNDQPNTGPSVTSLI